MENTKTTGIADFEKGKDHLREGVERLVSCYYGLEGHTSEEAIQVRASCVAAAFYLRGALTSMGDKPDGRLFVD